MIKRKRDPVISVITVSYNSGQTLARALRSVEQQDWPKIQHILIDGGSTDSTPGVIEHFRSHLAYVASEPDNGIYDAMNKGLAEASGDIICFLNADDQYASRHVLTQVAYTMSENKLDALLGDVAFFNESDPETITRRYRSQRFRPERLAWGWMPAHPALFLSNSVVKRVGPFNTEYKIAGDFEYVVRIFHENEVRYAYQPDVFVKMQSGGASNSGWKSKILLNKEVLKACRNHGINTNLLKILSKYPAKAAEFFNL